MIGLVRSEMLRFTSRRLFRFLGMLAVAGIVAAAIIAFIQSSKDPNAGREAAQREVEACQRSIADAPSPPPGTPKEFRPICPTVNELAAQFDKRFVYAETMPDATRGVAVALFILCFAVAASFVGAEWGSGVMTTLLTWEPRRGRVLAAKVIASVALLAVSTVVLLALLDLVFLPVAMLRGTTDGLSGAVWRTLSGIWLRGAALSVFGALAASAISTMFRNTAGAIGVAFGYGVILDNILGVIRGGRLRPWLLQHLFPRMLGLPVEVREPRDYEDAVHLMTLTPVRPIVVLSLYAALLLAAAYASFRTRDVT